MSAKIMKTKLDEIDMNEGCFKERMKYINA